MKKVVLEGGHAKRLDEISLNVTNLRIGKGRSELLASARPADGTIKNKLCVIVLEQNQHTNVAEISKAVRTCIDDSEGQCTKQLCLDITNRLMTL